MIPAPDLATVLTAADPMVPHAFRVAARTLETRDCATLRLEPVGPALSAFRPGQFMMLAVAGIGEIAISISGDPTVQDGTLTHTVRAVGAVSTALYNARVGSVVGVRGPYGNWWDTGAAVGRDVIIAAGGVGLAPLRPVIVAVLANRAAYRRVILVAGARSPGEFLFRDQLDGWAAGTQLETELTIDQWAAGWPAGVGFVTEPLARLSLDPGHTTAYLCGPEPMMRFSARTLLRKGMRPGDIWVSLERNMQCGIGLCGHCQLGPVLVCRDGPVLSYRAAGPLLATREL